MPKTKSKHSRIQRHRGRTKVLTGTMKRHPDGFGFVIPDDSSHEDIYVSENQMNSAFTNDQVEILVKTRKKGNKIVYFGSVKSILKRYCEFVTGPYKIINNKEFILDQSLGSNQKVIIENSENIKIKKGDWLKAKITRYPRYPKELLKGVVVSNLGLITSEAKDDILRALAQYNIDLEFPENVMKEANSIPDEVRDIDLKDRKDLTSKAFVTIDGATAKDFDDSIFIEKHGFGFRLFVAIADVSYYVQKGSFLDKEAYSRGNSSYFPNFVSPMLPHKLSDNLCSLKPNVLRLALVSEMDFDFKGNIINSKFYQGFIKSQKRFTYGEVQEIIDENKYSKPFLFLKEANSLAQILIKKHKQNKALDLEIPEVTVKVNENGDPIDVMKSNRLYAHELIEQFMLAANKSVSAFLEKKGFPVMYRIHEPPAEDNIKKLQIFSKKIGVGSLNKRSNMVKFISSIKGHEQESLFHILILRSLQQARYSAFNKGHYGLNFTSYTHFTSPIRRYCDLEIHRFVKEALTHNTPKINTKRLERKARFISDKEQASVKAERQVTDMKKARFLVPHLGKVFEGSVSSITSFGMFITLKDFYIDGLVRFKDLSDQWVVDDVFLKVVGKRSKYEINFGDEVEVQIVSSNIITGNIDFHIVKHKGRFANL